MIAPYDAVAELRIVQDEHKKFVSAIGVLTLRWADAESALYAILRYYSKVSEPIARSIFSGCRAKTMMEFIDNIAHNTNVEEDRRADLKNVFAHLTAINTMRDRLVHHVNGSEIEIPDGELEKRVLTNDRRVNRQGNAFRVRIGSSDIESISADLIDCCCHLLAHRDSKPFEPYVGSRGKPYAWLYKSPQPSRVDNKNLAAPETRQRPRRSSPR